MTMSADKIASVRKNNGKQFVMGIAFERTVKFAKVAWT